MKLLRTLNSQVNEIIIKEFSNKLIQKLIEKFRKQTKDSDAQILSFIEAFEKIKESLPVDKKNIEQYSYDQLKLVVNNKKMKSNLKKYFDFFRKTTNVSNNALKSSIRKFLEIQRFLPENKRDITKYEFLDITELLEKNFEKLMAEALLKKFKKESNFEEDTIKEYINDLFNVFSRIPEETGLILDLSTTDIEHLIDGLRETTDPLTLSKKDLEKIELVYDQDGVKVFQPKTKDQCIMLRNGRSWCTSRDGSGNLFYNYRFNNNLTLYYVINENLDFKNVNFATVILVEPDGDMRLADGTNSGRYSGHDTLPWDEIVSKLPWVENIKSLFVAKPLSKEEKDRYNQIKNVNVGSDLLISFNNNLDDVEFWMEITSNKLSDEQYASIPAELQKKYISLGFDLSANQIKSSSKPVADYYTAKKIESVASKSLSQLTDADIALINLPAFKNIKEKLKSSFGGKIPVTNNSLNIENLTSSDAGKFVALYGFDDMFEYLPATLKQLSIKNKGNNGLIFDIPQTITKFKNLEMLQFENCISDLPDYVCQLSELRILAIPNNPNLQKLPECIANLKALQVINNLGNNNSIMPESIMERAFHIGDGIWDIDDVE